jgi:hypothetical protein
MNEQEFLQGITNKARELAINPVLLLSGIEGLYTFKDVPLNAINYDFLDSLILTIFALRIGDQFHTLAEESLLNPNKKVQEAAIVELTELSENAIAQSSNTYLKSFATIINGKATIRKYHEKALEVAAAEIKNVQTRFQADSISTIILALCKTELADKINMAALFGA